MTTEISCSPAKNEPLVTVLIACCGQLEFTRVCVASLLRFTRQPYELVFFDSDSLDGTKEYLEGLACAAPVRVEIIQVSINGPKQAQRDGLRAVKGDFLALLNNDVIVTRGWLEKLIQLAMSNPNIGMVAPYVELHLRGFPGGSLAI